jgi:hypothetical protein
MWTAGRALLGGALILALWCAAAACDDEAEDDDATSQQQVERFPPKTYVPLVDAYSPIRGTVHYGSWLWQGDVDSSFALIVPDPVASYGALRFEVGCSKGEMYAYLAGVGDVGSGKVEVELSIDLDESETQRWQGDGVLGLSLGAESARALFERLRDAEQLELTILELRPGPTSIPIGELSRTPIIANLDYCGDYHPIEHRIVEPDYEPIVGLIGSVGPHLTYESIEKAFGSRSILTTTVKVASYTEDEAAIDLRLAITCNDSGRIGIRLEGLPVDTSTAEPIPVSITMDDASATTDDWWFVNDGGRVVADAGEIALLPALLLADHMTLAIPLLGIGPLEFDLSGMFETPVQGNIDHCGHYAES